MPTSTPHRLSFLNAAMAVVLALTMGCGSKPEDPASEEAPTRAAQATNPPDDLSQYLGQPVILEGTAIEYIRDPLVVDVEYAKVRLEPHGEMVNFGDPETFRVEVDDARVIVSPEQLMQPIVSSDGPLKDAEITTDPEDDTFTVRAKVTKLRLSTMVRARPMTSEDGRIALEIEAAEILGVGMKPVLELVEKFPRDQPGLLKVEEDRIYIDPEAIPGPPEIDVAFDRFDVTEDGLVLEAGDPPAEPSEEGRVDLRGGTLRNGHSILYGFHLDLQMAEGGPLRIGDGTLTEQMQEGYTKMRPGSHISLRLKSPAAVADADEDASSDEPEGEGDGS